MKGARKLIALVVVGLLEVLVVVLAFVLALKGKLTADFATIATVVAGGGAVAMLAFAGGNVAEYLSKGGAR